MPTTTMPPLGIIGCCVESLHLNGLEQRNRIKNLAFQEHAIVERKLGVTTGFRHSTNS